MTKYLLFPLLAGMAFFLMACEDESSILGLDNLPANDPMAVADTILPVVAYTENLDSIRADETSDNLVGFYADPNFGLTKAQFYTQLKPAVLNPDFGDSPMVDSVVFSLAYSGYYGDTLAPLTIRVRALTDTLSRDSIYYSDATFATGQMALFEETIAVQPHTPYYPADDTLAHAPQLRMHLDPAWGAQILQADSLSLASFDAFNALIYGLEVATPLLGGNIVYFDPLSAESKVVIYYNDSMSYKLVIDGECARVNNFFQVRNLTPGPLQYWNNATPFTDNNYAYVQAMSGVRTTLELPQLAGLVGDSLLINQATLVLPISAFTDDRFPPPSKLLLASLDSLGNNQFIVDQFEGEAYFGGYFNQDKQAYEFNIARYVHQVVNEGAESRGLAVLVSGAAVTANRVVLNNGEELGSTIELKIKYTQP